MDPRILSSPHDPGHRSRCDTCHLAIEYAMAAAIIESQNDIARKHLEDKPALLAQAKVDRRHAVALHNSDLEAIKAERDRDLAVPPAEDADGASAAPAALDAVKDLSYPKEAPASPSSYDPCNVCGKDQETWGPRVRAGDCVSTSHAACPNPFASYLRPTCRKSRDARLRSSFICAGGHQDGLFGCHPQDDSARPGGFRPSRR